jgi:hypothetical protein
MMPIRITSVLRSLANWGQRHKLNLLTNPTNELTLLTLNLMILSLITYRRVSFQL